MFGNDSLLSYCCVKCRLNTNAHNSEMINKLKEGNDALETELNDLKTSNAQSHQKISDLETNQQSSSDEFTDANEMINMSQLNRQLEKFGFNLMKKMREEINQVIDTKIGANINITTDTTTKRSNDTVNQKNIARQHHTLLPPPENKPKRNLYEMHVSKFRPGTTSEAIINHIIQKTNIAAESFKVEKLIGTKDEEYKMDYVSFKIITLNHEPYERIMDNNIWEPNLHIRDF